MAKIIKSFPNNSVGNAKRKRFLISLAVCGLISIFLILLRKMESIQSITQQGKTNVIVDEKNKCNFQLQNSDEFENLSKDQFMDIIKYLVKDIPIKPGNKIIEFGCDSRAFLEGIN